MAEVYIMGREAFKRLYAAVAFRSDTAVDGFDGVSVLVSVKYNVMPQHSPA